MLKIKNDKTGYGLLAILLHWLIAAIVITMLIIGLYMTDLPLGTEKLKWYGLHKSIGIIILMLISIRLIWRLMNITPSLGNLPRWEKFAARTVHWAFYVFLFAMPLSGWMMSSAAGLTVSFFGWFNLPNFVPENETLFHFMETAHTWLAYGLIATICLHVAAALKHSLIDQDDILLRMLKP